MGGQFLTRDDIRKVGCPMCGAAPGAPCRHVGARAAKKERQGINHDARMRRAQEELVDRSPPQEVTPRQIKPARMNHYAKEALTKPLPICPRCGYEAREEQTQYGPRTYCCGLWSWDRHPLVDRATHKARREAHAAFDPLWKDTKTYHGMSRRIAYRMLIDALGITPEECHMKLMSRALAERVPGAVEQIKKVAKEIPF